MRFIYLHERSCTGLSLWWTSWKNFTPSDWKCTRKGKTTWRACWKPKLRGWVTKPDSLWKNVMVSYAYFSAPLILFIYFIGTFLRIYYWFLLCRIYNILFSTYTKVIFLGKSHLHTVIYILIHATVVLQIRDHDFVVLLSEQFLNTIPNNLMDLIKPYLCAFTYYYLYVFNNPQAL